ncbi:MAG TPA: 6-phosphogluconolactonase [Pyrinomonadaceae bacterium]|nr:6-phosphogluconolactonase [Pyrinomonadaceae bacterium]
MEPRRIQDNVRIFNTPEDVALAAADELVAYAREAIADHEWFGVALAGGNTPRRVYELLGSDPHKKLIEWSRVHLFFGDERCVPPVHPDSNYRMVYEALVSNVEIPEGNVHRIVGENDPPAGAAAYEQELRRFFTAASLPRFDLVLLGMGEDGHTASLFPKSDALKEQSKWVVATQNLQSQQDRISLTLPALNHAAHVLFLITGSNKATRLSEVLRIESGPEPLPAQLISPVQGTLEWLIDRAAASQLSS